MGTNSMTARIEARTTRNARTDCNLCGTRNNVDSINYGEYGQGFKYNISVCPDCRRWLGEFLLNNKTSEVKTISEQGEKR